MGKEEWGRVIEILNNKQKRVKMLRTIQEHKKNILSVMDKLTKGEGCVYKDFEKMVNRLMSELEECALENGDFAASIISLRMFLETIIMSLLPTILRIYGHSEEDEEYKAVAGYLNKIIKTTDIIIN